MAKTRRDPKGRALQKGEAYRAKNKMYSYAYMDPMGVRRYIYSKNLLTLRDKEKELCIDKLDGIDSYLRAKATVNFLFDRYITTKNNLRSDTRTGYIYTYNKYIKPALGNRKIGDIRSTDILYFYETKLKEGFKPATVESMHTVLHAIFKIAIRDDIIRKNPTAGMFSEAKAAYTGIIDKRHALTHAEETEFLRFLEEPEYEKWRSLFIFMFGTGCRVGEVIGIRWDDIDFDSNEISINHDITYGPREKDDFKCSFEVGPPKTAAGIRTIPLMKKVREALLNEREKQEKYGLHNIATVDGMTGFVFCNRYLTLHKPSTINKAIVRIVDTHNTREQLQAAKENREPLIIPRFSCHITRHTFCTEQISS